MGLCTVTERSARRGQGCSRPHGGGWGSGTHRVGLCVRYVRTLPVRA